MATLFTWGDFLRACAVWGLVLGVSAGYAAENANEAMAARGAMFAYVLDTGTPSLEPVGGATLVGKSGWALLEEDTLSHAFQGDAVILNDKVALILRRNGPGAELYALANPSPVCRATLSPATGTSAARLKSVEVTENTPAAVALLAHFQADGGLDLALSYRLTTGQIQIEMRAGEGVERIQVLAPTNHIVVPDFFADDLVYTVADATTDRAGLPAENFYLHLAGNGNAILTCVWEAAGRYAQVRYGEGGEPRRIVASEIECGPDEPIWVSLVEQAGIWHEAAIPATGASTDIALDWKPPFPAKWRASFTGNTERARSWNVEEERIDRSTAPGVGDIVYPCWFDGDTPMVRLPDSGNTGRNMVLYPIDRTKATPLDQYVLVDVMRNTLGMGPCQYILDLEGLDAQSSPTPALVCEWAETRFEKKRAAKEADKIRERLDAMVHHIAQAEERIARYAAFQRDAAALAKATNPNNGKLLGPLADVEEAISGLEVDRRSPDEARQLADQLLALVGAEDWQDAFREVSARLHAIGAAQDRTLATCRMSLRRLQQWCRMAPDRPGESALEQEIGNRVATLLGESV